MQQHPLSRERSEATGLADAQEGIRDLDWEEILRPLEELSDCSVCPRDCRADRRADRLGYCRSGAGFSISSIFPHKGEEPVLCGINGICNVFFSHCNMQCIYCQNHQISRNRNVIKRDLKDLKEILGRIMATLKSGAHGVGFVSPAHFGPQVKVIIGALRALGHHPVFIYNTNSYERKETIESLEGAVDAYLPDMKYMDSSLAREYSDTPLYPEVAAAAIKEMYRQKGPNIFLSDDGLIESGLIVRHLILPGQTENSKAVLRFIAEELSPAVHVSLMSQYHPSPYVTDHPALGRTLHPEEYEEVLDELERLGFYRGWIQEPDSTSHYMPDFSRDRPFDS
jgi:putative pyruvate formate lyase activating enzyme